MNPAFRAVRKTRNALLLVVAAFTLTAVHAQTSITGLYAAGEVTGFNGLNGKAGLEGTFIGPSILQGRILGRNLATMGGGQVQSRPPAVAGKTAPVDTPCESCHPLAKEIATSRKGYWHFERVHRAVLDRDWNCNSCHAELAPFIPSHHKSDPLAQIAACARCHLGTE